MNNWVGSALISVINRRMFMSNLNSSFGELYILHKVMSVKFSLVNESGGILLGTFLLGDWEEIKLNRDLHTLICWWKHSANEKWFRRGYCLCTIRQMHATHVYAASPTAYALRREQELTWSSPSRRGRGAARLPLSTSTPEPLCTRVGHWGYVLASLQHQSKLLQLFIQKLTFCDVI